ncbi:MAG: hypothetical protein QXF76_03145 [Candidatus Anstonellales archaeon]
MNQKNDSRESRSNNLKDDWKEFVIEFKKEQALLLILLTMGIVLVFLVFRN